jgi:hypothetical protein
MYRLAYRSISTLSRCVISRCICPVFWKTSFALGRPLAVGVGKFNLMHLQSLYMYHDRAGARGEKK